MTSRILPVCLCLLSCLFLPTAPLSSLHASAAPVASPVRQGRGSPAVLAEITVNRSVTVREIEVAASGGRAVLKFPVYVSRAGKVYPQVRLLDDRSLKTVADAIASKGRDVTLNPGKTGYRVTKFEPFRRRGSKLRAFAAVSLFDALEIECRIMEGRNGPWVAWPARKPDGGGRWVRQVVFTDKRLKEDIETELLGRYEAMTAESGRGRRSGRR